MIEHNRIGGVVDKGDGALERAKKVDLLTLPSHVRGANCYNCRYIARKQAYIGFCANTKVNQAVNGRMCCALWDAPGDYRGFDK